MTALERRHSGHAPAAEQRADSSTGGLRRGQLVDEAGDESMRAAETGRPAPRQVVVLIADSRASLTVRLRVRAVAVNRSRVGVRHEELQPVAVPFRQTRLETIV